MQVAENALHTPRPRRLFASIHMTNEAAVSTLVFVPTTWPQESFLSHLAALRDREGIKDPTAMMRLAGLDPSLYTNWGKGKQPTTGSLDKLAPVLHVKARTLYVSAGRISASQLGMDQEPDLEVLPREFDELIAFYRSVTTDDARRSIRDRVAFSLRGLKALLAEPEPQPKPRRRSV